MAGEQSSDPNHRRALPRLVAAGAIAGRLRMATDRSSMQNARDAGMRHGHERCIRRQLRRAMVKGLRRRQSWQLDELW